MIKVNHRNVIFFLMLYKYKKTHFIYNFSDLAEMHIYSLQGSLVYIFEDVVRHGLIQTGYLVVIHNPVSIPIKVFSD